MKTLRQFFNESFRVSAHKNNYSWGKMTTVRDGNSQTFPLHPEHQKKLSKLRHGETISFKDETGAIIDAVRWQDGNKIFLKQRGSNDGVFVDRRHFTEQAEQLDELSLEKLLAYRKKARKFSDSVPDGHDVDRALVRKAIRRDVWADEADERIRQKTGTYNPSLIQRAKARLRNEEMEQDSAEQLDELSKKTLSSYVTKATKDQDSITSKAIAARLAFDGTFDRDAAQRKLTNRQQGKKLARRKIAAAGLKVAASESYDQLNELDENYDVEIMRHTNGTHYVVRKIHPKSGIKPDQLSVGEKLNDTHIDDLTDMGYRLKYYNPRKTNQQGVKHDIVIKRHADGTHYVVHSIHPKSGIKPDQLSVGKKLNNTHIDNLTDMGYRLKYIR